LSQSQYATVDNLIAMGLTQATAARFGNTAMNAALQAASSFADSYIAAQFTLPLQTSPQGWDMSLTLAVCHISTYYLYTQFGFNPAAPADRLIEERYKMAIGWLTQIREEEIFPAWADSGTGSPEAGPFVITDPPVGFTNRGLTDTINTGNPWDFWS